LALAGMPHITFLCFSVLLDVEICGLSAQLVLRLEASRRSFWCRHVGNVISYIYSTQ
jgi:hypothetical protein